MGQAMISSEVQRTLVKSPPELWAELSDPEALTRHLGALGEIRITRAEPEKLVEWEAERTSGVVHIKPSGWGTKVTLSVTKELEQIEKTVADEHAGAEQDAPLQADTESSARADPVDPELEHPTAADAEDEDDTPIAEIEPVALLNETPTAEPQAELEPEPATEPRRSFFARLFGRRRARVAEQPPSTPASEPESSLEEEPETMPATASSAIELLQARFAPAEPASVPAEPQPATVSAPEESAPALQSESVVAETSPEEQSVDLAAELEAAEEVVAEEVTAVLTAVLDRLGAAHHRPFSRS